MKITFYKSAVFYNGDHFTILQGKIGNVESIVSRQSDVDKYPDYWVKYSTGKEFSVQSDYIRATYGNFMKAVEQNIVELDIDNHNGYYHS